MKKITTDLLVVGGGAGGVTAAIQASRYGVTTILATEFSWLGGMLTSAGVAAPDGNELASWQTGLWGAYLRELQQRQTEGLDRGWVSLYTYHPACGARIFADWVKQTPNLTWIENCQARSVIKQKDRVLGVQFDELLVEAKITIDATELGDLLALAEMPYRWGWESFNDFDEPSLKPGFQTNCDLLKLKEKYSVQAPTWVFILQNYKNLPGSRITPLSDYFTMRSQFTSTWDNYGKTKFLNYGRLTDDLYMINWPIAGNDYGYNLDRLITSETAAKEFHQEAYQHSYNFATYLQQELGNNYSLANNIFPQAKNSLLPNLHSGFALHPYYRESRRLRGQTTITERDILPFTNGCVAPLPLNEKGEVDAIAIGNYANDHHYPDIDFTLESKSIRWGGRFTGTPFTIPYNALIPEAIDGLLVCEKNISVSHIANGSTRLQPVVMNIGQAAGMAAALSIEHNLQPRALNVRTIQEALLTDKHAPAAIIPLFNLAPNSDRWLSWQRYYLDCPEDYPLDGNCPDLNITNSTITLGKYYRGIFHFHDLQNYEITVIEPQTIQNKTWQLITIDPQVNRQFLELKSNQRIKFIGRQNNSGNWIIVEKILEE